MEMNASHEIALLNKRGKASNDSKLYFRKKGVDYYPDVTIRKMTELLHRDYEYSILDFGVLTPHTRLEFLHCYKQYGIRVDPAPLLCDPFHITSGCFHFFEQLMKGE